MISPEILLQAYREGYFPMADEAAGEIAWYTANPRAVLPLDPFHVPRRFARWLKTTRFTYTRDQAFAAVMEACADRDSTWISREMLASYTALHGLGHAHSVEVWQENALVGGLYGVHLGAAFFGESMFNLVEGASKAALVHLATHLQQQQFRLLEIQMITPLTALFGPQLVSRRDYQRLLNAAVRERADW